MSHKKRIKPASGGKGKDARHKLDKLIEHARKAAWEPRSEVDWDAGARELESLGGERREALRSVLSLVYYSDSQGRQILEALCRAHDKTPAHDLLLGEKAREFFELQIGDEARHARGIELLFDRLDLEPEPRALSHLLYSKLLLSEGLFDAKLILIYWYIEVLAKGIFSELKGRFPGSCIDGLFTKILRDEARHVGFGEVFIPAHAEASPDKRQMTLAYYSSAAVLPGLYRFTKYAAAARCLGLDVRRMFTSGIAEISQKAARLPAATGLVDLSAPAQWASLLL